MLGRWSTHFFFYLLFSARMTSNLQQGHKTMVFCPGQAFDLTCPTGHLATAVIQAGNHINGSDVCHPIEGDCIGTPTELQYQIQDCLWKKQNCQLRPFLKKDILREFMRESCDDNIDNILEVHYLMVSRFKCVQEEDVIRLCSNGIANVSSEVYVLTQNYPRPYQAGAHCLVTLATVEGNGLAISAYVPLAMAHKGPVCDEEGIKISSQSPLMVMKDTTNIFQREMYFCQRDIINLTVLGSSVNIEMMSVLRFNQYYEGTVLQVTSITNLSSYLDTWQRTFKSDKAFMEAYTTEAVRGTSMHIKSAAPTTILTVSFALALYCLKR